MSYSDPNQNPIPETYTNNTKSMETVEKVKLYQAFIFSIPICFTFIVLFVFYVIYRRRHGTVDWSSLGMRGTFVPAATHNISSIELGLRKEVREMLPIVIFKESFSINDSQCSVCLGDYQADEKLQQIPACGHTFHMNCIDLWLTSHTTCPLCRLSLIPKFSLDLSLPIPELVTSTEDTNGRGSSTQQESHSTTETVDHIHDDQEGTRNSTEVLKETQENDQNIVETSDACCNSRLG